MCKHAHLYRVSEVEEGAMEGAGECTVSATFSHEPPFRDPVQQAVNAFPMRALHLTTLLTSVAWSKAQI